MSFAGNRQQWYPWVHTLTERIETRGLRGRFGLAGLAFCTISIIKHLTYTHAAAGTFSTQTRTQANTYTQIEHMHCLTYKYKYPHRHTHCLSYKHTQTCNMFRLQKLHQLAIRCGVVETADSLPVQVSGGVKRWVGKGGGGGTKRRTGSRYEQGRAIQRSTQCTSEGN